MFFIIDEKRRIEIRYQQNLLQEERGIKMRLLLYPDGTKGNWKYSRIKLYAKKLRLKIVTNPLKKYDIALYWSYHKSIREPDETLLRLVNEGRIINAGCTDITKSKVEAVMKQTFGYNATIDPQQESVFVEKSESQATHVQVGYSAKIMTSFTSKKPGYIYIKLIDNRVAEDRVRDHRVFVFGDRIPLAFVTEKPISYRFSSGAKYGSIRYETDVDSLFSKEEQGSILRFCRNFPVEYTELDVLRDADGRIYVVDCNNVPGRAGLKQRPDILKMLSYEFRDMLERYIAGFPKN